MRCCYFKYIVQIQLII